jgi:hypothetical protein
MIDNPEYKGVWAPAQIANPKFVEDKTPLKSIGKIGAVALEIWTMSKAGPSTRCSHSSTFQLKPDPFLTQNTP